MMYSLRSDRELLEVQSLDPPNLETTENTISMPAGAKPEEISRRP